MPLFFITNNKYKEGLRYASIEEGNRFNTSFQSIYHEIFNIKFHDIRNDSMGIF